MLKLLNEDNHYIIKEKDIISVKDLNKSKCEFYEICKNILEKEVGKYEKYRNN